MWTAQPGVESHGARGVDASFKNGIATSSSITQLNLGSAGPWRPGTQHIGSGPASTVNMDRLLFPPSVSMLSDRTKEEKLPGGRRRIMVTVHFTRALPNMTHLIYLDVG